jgi:hypothetical protein
VVGGSGHGGGIVEILKREDFGDHWQALTPDGVNDHNPRMLIGTSFELRP